MAEKNFKGRQTLKCRMAKVFTMRSPGKQYLCNEKKYEIWNPCSEFKDMKRYSTITGCTSINIHIHIYIVKLHNLSFIEVG